MTSSERVFCNRCGLASAGDAQFCQGCGAPLQGQLPEPPRIAALAVASAPHYGGFWIRVVSAVLDVVVFLAAMFPIRMLLGSAVTLIGMNASISTHEVLQARRWARIGIGIILAWMYRAGMESSIYQATLGKLAVRLKVTDLDGKRISLARATARYFAKYLNLLSLGLGYLMVGFDEQKQGLHDRVAGTLVQYRRETT